MLRNKYLDRNMNGMDSTFHSVILAWVYDVKNLKLKIRSDEKRKYNSPWNVCANESRASSLLEGYAECS
ncbi:MAG: hypothetical protein MJZ24_09685 [Paludibacteraceae bacterium]|nr:hypothetical protein [Paludibacteraceae bacterium]